MIKGTKRIPLTREAILARITEYDIFRYYMPKKWKINQVTNSPFREDKNPSFMIGNRSGHLTFIDYADQKCRGDCFTFVKIMYNLPNMDAILRMIDRDFNLNIVSGKSDKKAYKKITEKYEQPESKGKRYSLIQTIVRPFTKEELAFWNQFHQSKEDLKANNIYSIKKLFLNKKEFYLDDNELRFGYYYDGHWKIYRPHLERRYKWLPNNVPNDYLDGKENLVKDKPAFINKSKKDKMIIKKFYPYTCDVQSEGIACFSEDNVSFLKENSSSQILSFDSDIPGVQSSLEITQEFGFDYCNVPKKYLREGIKDWADLAQVKGMSEVEKVLKQYEII